MSYQRLAFAGVLAVLVLLTQSAGAQHCVAPTTSVTSADQVVVDTRAKFYLAVDTCVGCFGVFLYEETNTVPGLQREDVNRDDTCHGIGSADTNRLA